MKVLQAPAPRVHHIGVQTYDLANSVAWYQDYFGCQQNWSTDKFSELTRSRLPGVVRLTEMVVGDVRFHLFERHGPAPQKLRPDEVQFQHVCLAADSGAQLRNWRHHWIDLFRSGRYEFAQHEQPTEIVIDDDAIESFYCLDVNGLEFEFTHVPGDTQ